MAGSERSTLLKILVDTANRVFYIYPPPMRRCFFSGLIVSLSLVLLTAEFADALGLSDYDDPGLAQNLCGIVSSDEDENQLSDHHQTLKTVCLFSSAVTDPYFRHAQLFRSLVHDSAINKASFRLFKLHRAFLI
jgi:hypothetical protein